MGLCNRRQTGRSEERSSRPCVLDMTGQSVTLDSADPAPGYTCSVDRASISTLTQRSADGRPDTGRSCCRKKSGSSFRQTRASFYRSLQPHAGIPEKDQTSIGSTSRRRAVEADAHSSDRHESFTIPPNASNYKVEAVFPLATPLATHIGLTRRTGTSRPPMRVEMKAPNRNRSAHQHRRMGFQLAGLYRYQQPSPCLRSRDSR